MLGDPFNQYARNLFNQYFEPGIPSDPGFVYFQYKAKSPTSNTFRSRPEPREGFIDARRSDGCVAVITTVEVPMFTDVEDRQQEELLKELEAVRD